MSEFVKINNTIIPKPNGFDYDLIPGKIYDLVNYYSPQLQENGEFNFPEKIYDSEKDKKFRKLVLNHFHKTSKQSTGVLLSGEKGTGKTIQAKLIAKECGLPIINVPNKIQRDRLVEFFKSFTTEVCVIFDEFDKYFESSDLLTLLDGVSKTTKMLVLFTCNDLDKISDYLLDRCSRIRYLREFTSDDNKSFIPEIISELELNDYKDELLKFCNENIKYPTIDNIKSYLYEFKDYIDAGLETNPLEVAEFLNITLK